MGFPFKIPARPAVMLAGKGGKITADAAPVGGAENPVIPRSWKGL
jgi:hypothetical protein